MPPHRTQSDFSLAEWILTDPGDARALPFESTGVVPLVTTAAQTRTLAAPVSAGIFLTLAFKTDGGDCVVTAATAINRAGNTIMTFSDAGEEITLHSIPVGSAFMWRVSSNDGVALS